MAFVRLIMLQYLLVVPLCYCFQLDDSLVLISRNKISEQNVAIFPTKLNLNGNNPYTPPYRWKAHSDWGTENQRTDDISREDNDLTQMFADVSHFPYLYIYENMAQQTKRITKRDVRPFTSMTTDEKPSNKSKKPLKIKISVQNFGKRNPNNNPHADNNTGHQTIDYRQEHHKSNFNSNEHSHPQHDYAQNTNNENEQFANHRKIYEPSHNYGHRQINNRQPIDYEEVQNSNQQTNNQQKSSYKSNQPNYGHDTQTFENYGQPYEQPNEQSYEQSYKQSYDQSYDQSYEQTHEQPHEQTHEQPQEKPHEQPSERLFGQPFGEPYEQPYELAYIYPHQPLNFEPIAHAHSTQNQGQQTDDNGQNNANFRGKKQHQLNKLNNHNFNVNNNQRDNSQQYELLAYDGQHLNANHQNFEPPPHPQIRANPLDSSYGKKLNTPFLKIKLKTIPKPKPNIPNRPNNNNGNRNVNVQRHNPPVINGNKHYNYNNYPQHQTNYEPSINYDPSFNFERLSSEYMPYYEMDPKYRHESGLIMQRSDDMQHKAAAETMQDANKEPDEEIIEEVFFNLSLK